jgi:16S rRNA (cytosine967-C5)-methyltransferase
MTPAARLQATLDILERIESARIPMDGTVGDYMRHRKYIGAKDRAAIVERVYKIVRAYARLCWWLTRTRQTQVGQTQVGQTQVAQTQTGQMQADQTTPTPRLLLLAWMILGEGKKETAMTALFTGEHYAPASLSEEERGLMRLWEGHDLEHPDMPDAVRVECPPDWEQALRARFGDGFVREMTAMMAPAPLDLRVNLRKLDRAAAQASLGKDRVETIPTRFSPWGLRAKGKAFLSHTKAFVKGMIEIQDEGSQLIALLCSAKGGQQVLDYCAGAGGKTLALAASMGNKGRIVACDIEESRLKKARPRFKRANVADIVEVRPLSDEKNRKWLRRQKGTFDVVLVDAPCSGTGTWRRNPDLRWRHFGPPLESLLTTQAEILDRVGKTVKEGGRLVYATCSLLAEENERQVEAFLTRDPSFAVLPLDQAWPADQGSHPPCEGPYMRLTPDAHDTDGFFAAVLIRQSAVITDKDQEA